MVSSCSPWRPLGTRWAGPLALILCLGAGSGSLRSEERLAANPAVSHETGGLPVGVNAQHPTEAWHADDAKVRYLIEELITQRFESARLSIELADARAEAAENKEVSRQQAALLEALTAVLATRDRQFATLRSETAALRQRLEAAQAELQLRGVQNSTLAAELAAAHKAAETATIMALENLALINAQIGLLSAAAGHLAVLDRTNQPSELLLAARIDLFPVMPRQKPHLKATK